MARLDQVRLGEMDVEVVAVTDDGWPADAVFRFDTELHDPALRSVRWDAGSFVAIRTPGVGDRATVL
jgi:hypothetical protein